MTAEPNSPDSQAKRRGRPPVLDDFARGKLAFVLACGFSRREAGAWAGCSHFTVGHLLSKDPEFLEDVKELTERVRLFPLLRMYQAAGETWRSAARIVLRMEQTRAPLSTDELLRALHVLNERVVRAEQGEP